MAAEIERRLALHSQGSMVPFAVIEKSTHRAVGMTTFMNIERANRRVEIGSTWYRKRVQRSALEHRMQTIALDATRSNSCSCIARGVPHALLQQQSRAAIERLGAKLDGVLRQHQIGRNGTLRDTCVYSMLDREWPAVKAHLMHRLQRPEPLVIIRSRRAIRLADLQLFPAGRVLGLNEHTPVQHQPPGRTAQPSSRPSCVPIRTWSSRRRPASRAMTPRRRILRRRCSSGVPAFPAAARQPTAGGWLKTVTTNLTLNHLTRYRKRWRLFSELRDRG